MHVPKLNISLNLFGQVSQLLCSVTTENLVEETLAGKY